MSTRQNLSDRRRSIENNLIESITAFAFVLVVIAIIALFIVLNPF